MNKDALIFVAGHNGMVGSAIMNKLNLHGYSNIITRSSKDLDLRCQNKVLDFFKAYNPEYVFLAAAKVGGILANSTRPADFIYDNVVIQSNVIHSSYLTGVKKLLFLGSSCIYPKHAPQPIKEEYLLSGLLEETNEPYAVAKIAGIKMCDAYRKQFGCNFISAMPTNLYGINDNYDLNSSHVIPALLKKFADAVKSGTKIVEVWGTGKVYREFLHVDDLADACIFLMNQYNEGGAINIGYGEEISISELAGLIAYLSGFKGQIKMDVSKPDGTPRKLLDSSRINQLGWSPKISLDDGIKDILKVKFDITPSTTLS